MTETTDHNQPDQDYAKAYSEESLWEKITKFAGTAGKDIIEKALVLYYCYQDPDTPAWAKAIIVGALGYFIVPLDAIPDLLPGAGYADDLGVLAFAIAAVLMHIKPEHKQQAKEKLRTWFGDAEHDLASV